MRRARPLAVAVLLAAAGRPLAAQAATATPERVALTARVDSLLSAFRHASGAPGVAAAVTIDGSPLLERADGLADLDHDVPVRPWTVFQTGSVTKQVTAALVLQLADSGRVRLDDRIDAHVPGLPEAWRAVTVAQLLNHTSGVPSYTDAGPRWVRRWGEVLTPDSLVALTAAEPMAFAPGTRWRYSNTGYVLLGMLLERAHGRTWAQVVEERVTRALDLPTVRPCDARAVVPHRARGYDPAPDPAAPTARAGVLPAPYLDMSHPYAAGALCASAMDLARWGDALMRGRVVTPASFARMTTAEGAARPWRYGYGLMLDSLGDRALVLHGGDIPGFTAATALVPAAGVSIAVLASRGNVDAEGLARDVARAVLGMPAEVPPTPVALPADDRRRAAGHYVLDTPGQPMPFALVEAGDALALQPAGGPALPLVFHGRRRLPAGGGHALVFGAGFDARFRLEVAIRDRRVAGGRVAQGGGTFEVRRVAAPGGR